MATKRAVRLGLRGVLLAAAFGSAAVAQPREGASPSPPPEAFEACASRRSGDACTVSFRERSLTGTCVSWGDQRLVCRPDRLPPRPPGA